jgi:putative flippase GtrA
MKGEMLRFFCVGLASNLINYVIYVLVRNVGASLMIASVAGYAVGLYNSYYFGRHWVFSTSQAKHDRAALRFIIVYLAGGVGMAGIIVGLDHLFGWDYRVTWFAGAAFAFANNFLGSKWLVFKRGDY